LVENSVVDEFDKEVSKNLGFRLKAYQRAVAEELVRVLDRERFVVVSMPTGSGKTVLEMFVAFYARRLSARKILVLEPTRFLCDQMYRVWVRVFGDSVAREYEGVCNGFLEKPIVISTPQTACKCVEEHNIVFDAVVVDEVHHAFGGKYYAELLSSSVDGFVVGFTALLPSARLDRLSENVLRVLGRPYILAYDFKALRELDPTYTPPKAIADLFDAEMDGVESHVYDLLFRGVVEGLPQTVKFLEITLARYGVKAFCESCQRAVAGGKIEAHPAVDMLCSSAHLSHKARVLAEVLSSYGVGFGGVSPAIVFTSRKATAYEFRDAIVRELGLPPSRVEVLTSDMDRKERLKLIDRVKRGEVDVVISTIVGEEGVDLPEANLLVMSDVPRSPLRFYQRLGRLIRLSSPHKIKYLVVTLTPKTREYYDLEEALLNLHREGVDVSYILSEFESKTATARVAEIVKEMSSAYGISTVPYPLIVLNTYINDPPSYLATVAAKHPEVLDNIKKALEGLGIKPKLGTENEVAEAIKILTLYHMARTAQHAKRALHTLEKLVSKGAFTRELDKAVLEGKLLYIYDIESMGSLIADLLLTLYEYCKREGQEYCRDKMPRLDRKNALRLYARYFPVEKALDVYKMLEKVRGGRGPCALIFYSHNPKNNTLVTCVRVGAKINNVVLDLTVQINYHNIAEEKLRENLFKQLVGANLDAIACKALEKLEELLELFRE